MKKTYLLAAVVLAACVSCKKSGPVGEPFVAGQKVTLTVAAEGAASKVTSDVDGSGVKFTWDEGDTILVTVGSSSAKFGLKGGAGSANGTFEGEMPEDGSTFSVQYPVEPLSLTNQTYTDSEPLPSQVMKMTATNCTLGSSFNISPAGSAFRLNLFGDSKVTSIVLTVNSVTYTLDCGTGVQLSEDETVPFSIVTDANGNYTFSAKVNFKDVDGTARSRTLSPSAAQTFTTGKILDMPDKCITYPMYSDLEMICPRIVCGGSTLIWAPVNCGYDTTNTNGLLYQFGRMVGQDNRVQTTASHDMLLAASSVWKSGTGSSATSYKNQITDPADGIFYCTGTAILTDAKAGDYHDWYSWKNNRFSAWPTTAPESTTGIGNPCPDGWKMPSGGQMTALFANCSSWDSTNKGLYFSGDNTYSSTVSSVFLPAAGDRNVSGEIENIGIRGLYWSLAVSTDNGASYDFTNAGPIITSHFRGNGESVRCIFAN